MCSPIRNIIKFNVERNLTEFKDSTEIAMLTEELEELKKACEDNDNHERLNALCDLVVLAVGGIHKLGYSPVQALMETVDEVLSRKGEINSDTGKWEKDKNQDPSTLYTPNYSNARYP